MHPIVVQDAVKRMHLSSVSIALPIKTRSQRPVIHRNPPIAIADLLVISQLRHARTAICEETLLEERQKRLSLRSSFWQWNFIEATGVLVLLDEALAVAPIDALHAPQRSVATSLIRKYHGVLG